MSLGTKTPTGFGSAASHFCKRPSSGQTNEFKCSGGKPRSLKHAGSSPAALSASRNPSSRRRRECERSVPDKAEVRQAPLEQVVGGHSAKHAIVDDHPVRRHVGNDR